MFGILKKLWDKTANTAGKDFGELEYEAGRPLYPIKPYLQQVSPELWRGSWPNIRMLSELRNQGITTIVNFCAERFEPSAIWIPVVDMTAPGLEQLEQFLKIPGPKYCHCEEGIGRTGCFVAGYRVKVQGWWPNAALEEAERFGTLLPDQKAFILSL